mmetsp:Transcript_2438/g.9622  ORF Transcript_2438/g.9622 Transcript_2438/m.9622 type:complete len:201 (-) Transcript_2438:752-1354(-)
MQLRWSCFAAGPPAHSMGPVGSAPRQHLRRIRPQAVLLLWAKRGRCLPSGGCLPLGRLRLPRRPRPSWPSPRRPWSLPRARVERRSSQRRSATRPSPSCGGARRTRLARATQKVTPPRQRARLETRLPLAHHPRRTVRPRRPHRGTELQARMLLPLLHPRHERQAPPRRLAPCLTRARPLLTRLLGCWAPRRRRFLPSRW